MAISKINKYQLTTPNISSVVQPLFEVAEIRMDKSCVANKSHQSSHYKIFFIEDGSGEYEIDFHQFSIKGTGMFYMSPGQVLTVVSESFKSGYQITFNREFYCVETHGKEIACNGILFNNVHRATFLQLATTEASLFQDLIQKMINELKNPDKAHQDLLDTYLRLFLIQGLRLHKEGQKDEDGMVNNERKLVGDFIALVDKNFRTIHAVSEYAQQLFVSPKSLAKRLNADGYGTPTEIIRDRIILEAKRMLRFSRDSVKEIAFGLGFEDPAYFTRYFKKATNQSPQAYRAHYLERLTDLKID